LSRHSAPDGRYHFEALTGMAAESDMGTVLLSETLRRSN
jgi:hypothetical protein